LTSHFNLPGNPSVERWVEKPFDGLWQKKTITISLHGKLDCILDSGNRLDVFDYKTRRGMSVSAIKGETKNDDGNYFRQLVFYKMLLTGSSQARLKQVSTSLVFLTPDDYGRCPTVTLPVEDSDIKNLSTEINRLIHSVWSGSIGREFCQGSNCQYCNFRRAKY
jgi:DNA helicase II / ATP-dependent DNA helicase PcrA